MKNVTLILTATTLVILIGGSLLLGRSTDKNEKPINSVPITENFQYFWSKNCSHCANVNKFVDGWDKKDLVKIEKFEINESEKNRTLFLEKGNDFCKIPTDKLGVPLLVIPEGKCYSGDTPIIEYLKGLEI